MGVVQRTIGVEKLVELRTLGILHVDNCEPIAAIGDVGVGPGDVEFVGIAERNDGAGNRPRTGWGR